MKEKVFDVLIVGAGPAGVATAMELGRTGLSIAVLDRATFPRDKTCGDALSVDVLNQLVQLSPDLARIFDEFELKTPSYGVKIVAPDFGHIDIPFLYEGKKKCGYICPRVDFDNLLLQQLTQFENVAVYENCRVQKIENRLDHCVVQTNEGTFTAQIIIGADGAQSIVSKQIESVTPERKHTSAGLRVYYEGVSSFHQDNFIELYFFREILPGYLWIFPLPNGRANVGIGMLSSEISRKRINLKETLHNLLTNHQQLKERFRDAKPLGTVKGFGLPLGSKKRNISGERFLLAGDAASLIDPFTGEGIGNAIRSGRIAAHHVQKCFANRDFSAPFNLQYDDEIYSRMWKELRISKALQDLCRYPWLFNFVIRKANQNKHILEMLTTALSQVDQKKLLVRPGFYYRLFFT